MECCEGLLVENENTRSGDEHRHHHCAYILPRQKRYCKIKTFPNYDFCNRHSYLERPLKFLEKPEDCSVCLDPFEEHEIALKCGHWIHKSCIIKSGKNKCPICRFTIYLKPEEMKRCKMYNNTYMNDTPTQYTMNVSTVGVIAERIINSYPPQIRSFIEAVGIDNIIDVHHIRPGLIENQLQVFIQESLHIHS